MAKKSAKKQANPDANPSQRALNSAPQISQQSQTAQPQSA